MEVYSNGVQLMVINDADMQKISREAFQKDDQQKDICVADKNPNWYR